MWKRVLRTSVNCLPWWLRRRIKDLPLIAPLQRWFFNKTLAGQTFVHVINAGPAKGLVYPISLPQDKAIWAGTYEARFADALAKAVQVQDVCYDIGGYRGFMSGVFARAGARLVVVFEPFPSNCAQIQHLADLNPVPPIRLAPMAVGDRDGEVEFRVMPEESMGKLAESRFQPSAAATASIMVPIRRLDGLIAEGVFPPPNVIKIDVEGAEAQVLRGAADILGHYRPTVLLEVHSAELEVECCGLLRDAAYEVSWLSSPSAASGAEPTRHCLATPISPPLLGRGADGVTT